LHLSIDHVSSRRIGIQKAWGYIQYVIDILDTRKTLQNVMSNTSNYHPIKATITDLIMSNNFPVQ